MDNSFLMRRWVDGCVVFDRETGNSYAFKADAADMLMAVEQSQGSLSIRTMIEQCQSDNSGSVATMDTLGKLSEPDAVLGVSS